jgi:hypothetical protein
VVAGVVAIFIIKQFPRLVVAFLRDRWLSTTYNPTVFKDLFPPHFRNISKAKEHGTQSRCLEKLTFVQYIQYRK